MLIRGDKSIQFMDGSDVIMAPNIAFWRATLPLSVMSKTDARPWAAALAQLSKLSNVFFLTFPDYTAPATGYAGATPLVSGASQTGTSLTADGVSNSTAILLPGDYIEVNNEFKIVTLAATSNGSGQVTITFEPALRSSPADNAAIIIQSPVVIMRLIEALASWDVNLLSLHDIALDVIESRNVTDVITNGTFTTDTDWTKNTWTIGSGTANATTVSSDLEQTIAHVDGQTYRLTYTMTRSAGSLTPKIGGTSGTVRSSSGTYTENIVMGTTNALIEFTGSGFTGTLDNVSLRG